MEGRRLQGIVQSKNRVFHPSWSKCLWFFRDFLLLLWAQWRRRRHSFSHTHPSRTRFAVSPLWIGVPSLPSPNSYSQLVVRDSSPALSCAYSLIHEKAVPEFDIASYSTPIELVKCKMQVQMMNFRPLDPPSPGRIPRRPATITPGSPTLHGTGGKAAASLNPLYSNHDRSALHHSACTKSHTLPAAAVNVRPPGAIALVRSIVDTYGVRGLWLGHTGTILRETGSSAAWFVTKEWVARKLIERRVHPSPHLGLGAKLEPTSIESAISGAVAGAVGALLFYPADTVKSAIQTEEELRPQSYNSKGQKAVFPKSTFVGTARMMYARHGLKGLYAGCGMTVARAVPSSCIIFVVYDGLISLFP